MENNFKCSCCSETYYISKYIYLDGSYFEKIGNSSLRKPLRCSCCQSLLEPIEKKGELGFMLGKFSSLSPQEKKAVLQKRSIEHAKRHIQNPLD